MSSGRAEGLVAAHLLNKKDDTLLSWKEIEKSFTTCSGFMLAYGLRPDNLDDIKQAVSISRALKAGDLEEEVSSEQSWTKVSDAVSRDHSLPDSTTSTWLNVEVPLENDEQKSTSSSLPSSPLSPASPLTAQSLHKHDQLHTIHVFRQFKCPTCLHSWWKKCPENKPVSKCHGACKEGLKFNALPKEEEMGYGHFACTSCQTEWTSHKAQWQVTQPCKNEECLAASRSTLPYSIGPQPYHGGRNQKPAAKKHLCALCPTKACKKYIQPVSQVHISTGSTNSTCSTTSSLSSSASRSSKQRRGLQPKPATGIDLHVASVTSSLQAMQLNMSSKGKAKGKK